MSVRSIPVKLPALGCDCRNISVLRYPATLFFSLFFCWRECLWAFSFSLKKRRLNRRFLFPFHSGLDPVTAASPIAQAKLLHHSLFWWKSDIHHTRWWKPTKLWVVIGKAVYQERSWWFKCTVCSAPTCHISITCNAVPAQVLSLIFLLVKGKKRNRKGCVPISGTCFYPTGPNLSWCSYCARQVHLHWKAQQGEGRECAATLPPLIPFYPSDGPPRKKENVISCACPFAYFCFSSLFRDVNERRPE